jgi:Cd2+/Zn2+-exporting ATPase
MMNNSKTYRIKGLDCAHCATKIENALREDPNLKTASVNYATMTAVINPEYFKVAQGIIDKVEPGVRLEEKKDESTILSTKELLLEEKVVLWRLAFTVLLFMLGYGRFITAMPSWAGKTLLISGYLLVGYEVLWSAARNFLQGRFLDEMSLMSIATLGAIAIGEIPEAIAVMWLYTLGELLQKVAVTRSRSSIAALIDIRPDKARVIRDNKEQVVSPSEVMVGESITVFPGERIPLDGVVIEGEAYLDTSALTGESVPRRAMPGDTVLAGMISTDGKMVVEVSKVFTESSLAKIVRLVEEASERKARTEQLITVFSRYYVPAIVALALAVAFIPPIFVKGAIFTDWWYRAMVLLVISCPCALVISVPLSYFCGIGAVSREGALVKGAGFLDTLSRLKTVALDKTGTLTKGNFKVTKVQPKEGIDEEYLLKIAASVEAPSTHPIARSIHSAYGSELAPVTNYQEIAGRGVKGVIQGKQVLAGNDRLMHEEGIDHPEDVCHVVGTVVYVAVDGVYQGYVIIADELRNESAEMIKELNQLGIDRVIILSGDDHEVVKEVARQLDIKEYYSNLLPQEKLTRFDQIKASIRPGYNLAFIGDGINDAPVLTRADVGIAMGGLGTDVAVESADVVIMEDKLHKLPAVIKIARNTKRVVVQNILFALGVKTAFMVLGVLGMATAWGAVFADVGVSLITLVNSSRLMRVRK